MLSRSLLVVPLLLVVACSASSSSSAADAKSGSTGSDSTDGSAASDGSDATDGTDGTDGSEGTDGTDGSGGIPKCQFQPPLGAKCNPYPSCESGCPDGQMCSVSETAEGIKRIMCMPTGTVALGDACSHVDGPFCEEGLCIDGQCRSFCVDAVCENGGSCKPYNGVPGKPTVCGAAQLACDPTTPTGDPCSAEKPCYLNSDETTDCKVPKGAGVQGDPCADSYADCAAGFACVGTKDGKVCGQLCAKDACSQTCGEGMSANQLSSKYSVCTPGEEQPPATPCTPLAQDCAGAAQGCYATQEGFVCLPKGNAAAGEECASANDCAPGAICFNNGRCVLMCDLNDPTNGLCETGVEAKCVQLGDGVGYCDE